MAGLVVIEKRAVIRYTKNKNNAVRHLKVRKDGLYSLHDGVLSLRLIERSADLNLVNEDSFGGGGGV